MNHVRGRSKRERWRRADGDARPSPPSAALALDPCTRGRAPAVRSAVGVWDRSNEYCTDLVHAWAGGTRISNVCSGSLAAFEHRSTKIASTSNGGTTRR